MEMIGHEDVRIKPDLKLELVAFDDLDESSIILCAFKYRSPVITPIVDVINEVRELYSWWVHRDHIEITSNRVPYFFGFVKGIT